MDNERKNPEVPENDDWLDEILGSQSLLGEIGPDEQAVASAGLTHPDDLELERIVQETLAGDWGTEPEEKTPQAEEAGMTQLFEPQRTPEQSAPQEPAKKPEPESEPEKIPEARQESAVRKIRPRMKKGYGLFGIPHLLATAVWLVIIIAIGVSLGRVVWVCAADLLAFGKEPQEVTITISQDDDITAIAQKLQKAGMVRYAGLFELFAELTGKGEQIESGTFTFNGQLLYDYNALIKAMRDYGPSQDIVEIMFPEGYSCAQIFALLEEKGVCTAAELEEYAANGELEDYWFLEGVERGHKYSLEGFLAPDTYEFYTNDEPGRVLDKFLTEFDSRIDSYLQKKFEALNEYLAEENEDPFTFHEVVIMASIIEKESANNLESYTISSVFYNRLTRSDGEPPILGSDATMKYAEEYYYPEGALDTEQAWDNCPYNTYTYQGLTPGAICNPGLNSLGAALSPEETDYYFFLFDEQAGVHRFSRTLAEHEKLMKELGYTD